MKKRKHRTQKERKNEARKERKNEARKERKKQASCQHCKPPFLNPPPPNKANLPGNQPDKTMKGSKWQA